MAGSFRNNTQTVYARSSANTNSYSRSSSRPSYNSYTDSYSIHGSGALAPNKRPQSPAPHPQKAPKDYREIERRIHERNKPEYEIVKDKKSSAPLLNIITVAIIGVFAFLWLFTNGYAMILNTDIAKINAEIDKAVDNNKAMSASLTQGINLAEIEKIAVTRLGMVKPEEYQKVYIDVPRESYAISYEAPAVNTELNLSIAGIMNLFLKER